VSNAAEAFQVSDILSFYYTHSAIDAFGKNPPLTIPDRQMQSFIIATNTHDQNVMRLDGQPYTFKSNDEVEVIAGKFKGVRGKVIRAGRQQRILIDLAGFMTFATAYVPTDFIRKI
jgi:transcription antitermination factor NusG